MRRAAPLPLLVLFSCGGGGAPTRPTTPAGAEDKPEALDRVAASAELRTAILDGYRLLGSGYDNVYLEGLAHDDELVIFGVGPEDVVVGFDARAAAVRAIFAGEPYELVSKNLEIGVSADGCCAWSSDDLSYRTMHGGHRGYFPLRSIGYYEQREGRWLKLLEHLAYDAPPEVAGEMSAAVDAGFAPRIPDGEVAGRVRDTVLAMAVHPDAALVGPGVTGQVVGLRLHISPTGTVAWAAALMKLSGPGGARDARATWILEAAPGGELRVVSTYISLPVTDAALAAAVFGPG